MMLEIDISHSVLIYLFIQQISHLSYLTGPYSSYQISVPGKFDVPPVLPGVRVRLLQYLCDPSFLLITAQVLEYPFFLLDGLLYIGGQLQGVILDTSILQNCTRLYGIIIIRIGGLIQVEVRIQWDRHLLGVTDEVMRIRHTHTGLIKGLLLGGGDLIDGVRLIHLLDDIQKLRVFLEIFLCEIHNFSNVHEFASLFVVDSEHVLDS